MMFWSGSGHSPLRTIVWLGRLTEILNSSALLSQPAQRPPPNVYQKLGLDRTFKNPLKYFAHPPNFTGEGSKVRNLFSIFDRTRARFLVARVSKRSNIPKILNYFFRNDATRRQSIKNRGTRPL